MVPSRFFLSFAMRPSRASTAKRRGRSAMRAGSPHVRQVRHHAGGPFLAAMAEPGGQRRRQAKPHGDGLAVQQGPVEAGLGLQRMAEGVAEVEQRAAALGAFLALVGFDHAGLEPAGFEHGMGQCRRVAGDDGRAVRLAPVPERALQQPVLGDFGIARAQFARRQRGQRVGIGQHDARLVEGAGQVLAGLQVHAGLAADAAVHLRQQRGGHLHEGHAAHRDRRGEAGEVAHHAAAERDHRRAPVEPGGQHGAPALRTASRSPWRPRPAAPRSRPARPAPRRPARRAAPAGAAGRPPNR